VIERVTVGDFTKALSETKKGIYIAPERRKLASGRMSCFYLNVGDVARSYPELKRICVVAAVQTFRDLGLSSDRVIGVPEGMNNLASSIGDELSIGQLRVRENQTGHGDQATIEGEYEPRMTVGIFEDVISTWGSTEARAINPLLKSDLRPNIVVSIVDRNYGGGERMRALGLISASFTDTREVIESLLRQDIPSLDQIKLLEVELSELTEQ